MFLAIVGTLLYSQVISYELIILAFVVGSAIGVPIALLMPMTEFERLNSDGRRMPVIDPAYLSTTLGNTALWTEDVNFTATSQYTNRRILEEGVDAAYIQGTAKINRLTVLTGVRGEWVATDTFTYFRARTTPVAAELDAVTAEEPRETP